MNEQQKMYFAEILTRIKPKDLTICGECGTYSLTEHMHTHYDSMGNEQSMCPECDLPRFWYSKFSSSHRRYFVRFDPQNPDNSIVKWGHPTEGNPLYIKGDKGENVRRHTRVPCPKNERGHAKRKYAL